VREVESGTVVLGRSHQFVVHDPKKRVITAPVFEERVLHHAIMNVCDPVFERWLIDDTHASRVGRGRGSALRRAGQFAARFEWCLKLDIRRYFDSIPHDRLLSLLARRFKERALLTLFERIVRVHGAGGRGLPIGSLMSQQFANFYLGWFDRYVKEQLRIPAYARYMDDSLLWSSSQATLVRALEILHDWLQSELGLELKTGASINRTRHGVDFLGCRVFPTHLAPNRRSRLRFQRRLRTLERLHIGCVIGDDEYQIRCTSLFASLTAAGCRSWKYRTATLKRLVVSSQEGAPTASTAAAVPGTTPSTCGRAIATGTSPGGRTTTSASVSSQLPRPPGAKEPAVIPVSFPLGSGEISR